MKLQKFIEMIGEYTDPNMKVVIHSPWCIKNLVDERLINVGYRIADMKDMKVLFFNICDGKLMIEVGH